MAVTFDAVGPSSAGAHSTGVTTLNWTHTVGGGAAGGVILAFVNVDAASGTSWAATVTCAGTSMTSVHAPEFTSDGFGGMIQAFWIAGVSAGSNAIAVTVTGGTPSNILGASLSFAGAGSIGTPALSNTASVLSVSVASNTSGNMIAGGIAAGDSALGAMSGAGTGRSLDDFSALNDTGNLSTGTAPATGSSVTLTWTGAAGTMALIAFEVKASATVPPRPPAPSPQLPPGWFPGSAAVTQDPGGIPFYPEPPPADATPAVIIPPTPDPAAAQPPLLPPGWFPGADKVTTEPGGIPFTQQPPPADPSRAILPPAAPDILGIADWLPLPPNWFPGSNSVTTDPGSIPFYTFPQPQTPPPAPPPVPVIAGLAGGGTGYFTDQNGNPRLYLADNPWGLPPNAGRWNGGNWHGDYDTYLGARGAQGFTAIYTDPLGNSVNGGLFADGRTYDGVYPFNSGATNDPSSGLNNTFWARIDYMVSRAAASGLTIFMNIAYCEGGSGDMDVGALSGKTAQQYTDYGTNLGVRYKNTANLVWVVGNDYFGSFDTPFTNILTGLRGAGDAHVISVHNMPESTSRQQLDTGTPTTWGVGNAQFNMVYTYNVTYLGTEQAYAEASPLPVILGDGYFYQGTSATFDRAVRQDVWHALSSGARGANTGSESIWQWDTNAAAKTTSENYYANVAGKIRTAYESLTGWHLLIPDTNSVLVTSGRGTRATPFTSGGGGGQYEAAFTDAYVSASRVPDGSLAVIYLSHATTIGIDQSKMAAGYTVTWIDPASGTKTAGTPGASYNSSAQGSNSAGDPDWVLALQGTPVTAPPSAGLPEYLPLPPGWFPGADRVTDLPGGVPFYVVPQPADQNAPAAAGVTTATAALAGAGAVTAVVTEAPIASLAGAGAVAAVVTQDAGTSTALTGAGTVTDVVTQTATAALAGAGAVSASAISGGAGTANLAGAGAVTALVTEAPIAAVAGAGAVAAVVTEAVTATAAGAGSITTAVTQTATASLAGAGSVTALVTEAATASAAAAGSITDVVTQAVIASLAGAGAVNATALGGTATANLAAAGSVTAVATVAAPATVAGAGSVAAVVTEAAKATVAVAGAVNVSGQITGTASMAAAGAVTAKVTQAVTAAPAGAGALAALATEAVTASLAAAGSVGATGGVQVAFTVGTLTAATSTGPGGGSALTGSTAPSSGITATDQRTGGPG